VLDGESSAQAVCTKLHNNAYVLWWQGILFLLSQSAIVTLPGWPMMGQSTLVHVGGVCVVELQVHMRKVVFEHFRTITVLDE
jgi:hypothetical protein